MLILCRDYQQVINSEHIARYFISKDSRDLSNIEWDLVCNGIGDADTGYYLATYKNEKNAVDSLYDLLVHLSSNEAAYTLKEDYDYEQTDNKVCSQRSE